jgi:hypothetical protein
MVDTVGGGGGWKRLEMTGWRWDWKRVKGGKEKTSWRRKRPDGGGKDKVDVEEVRLALKSWGGRGRGGVDVDEAKWRWKS